MIYLIGTGPGDPGLLTLRAAELLRRADLVVHDAAVSRRVVELARPDAELIDAGRIGDRGGPDHEVERPWLERAVRAEVAVRLFAGDPFASGEGVGDALALSDAGIGFEVVPGVPMGTAVPAYAGIPVGFPGAGRGGVWLGDDRSIDAGAACVRSGASTTLVVERVTAGGLAGIVARLVGAGCDAGVPTVLIARGASARQRTIVGPLGEIVARVERAGPVDRGILVVGETVRLREMLSWFESRPLFGRRIVVTRPRAQAADLVEDLETLGAEVVVAPMIRVVAPEDPAPLRRAVRSLPGYDWVIFTSVNGVDRFWATLEAEGLDARALGGVRVACIGPATSAALDLRGIRADVVPSTAVAEAVVDAVVDAAGAGGGFGEAPSLAGTRILLPLAAGARPVLAEGLAARAASVDRVDAYRSVPDAAGTASLRRELDAGEIDVLTFTSPSTVDNFVDAVGRDIGRAVVAVIGPVTARAARERGLPVDVEAAEHTIGGLVGALSRHFGREPRMADGV